jgi:hypothetical protein
MNSHNLATKLLLVCLAVFFLVVSQPRCLFGQTRQECGKPENGLQLSLFPAHGSPASSKSFQFRVEIRNVGSNNLLLKLGAMQVKTRCPQSRHLINLVSVDLIRGSFCPPATRDLRT